MLRKILEEEIAEITDWLEQHEDDIVRIVSFQWKGYLFTWKGDYHYQVDPPYSDSPVTFDTWESALQCVLERVVAFYEKRC